MTGHNYLTIYIGVAKSNESNIPGKPKGGPSREGGTALWVFRSELLL
jgi:hypothetical protein